MGAGAIERLLDKVITCYANPGITDELVEEKLEINSDEFQQEINYLQHLKYLKHF